MRFATIFYSNQLVDIFSYELPVSNSVSSQISNLSVSQSYTSDSTVVYNFHNLTFQERFFFFCSDLSKNNNSFKLNSIAELYPNAS
jgi:hypothetical protein